MKKGLKSFLLVVCVLALIASTVFATLAYLNSGENVVNTMTAGDVEIDMDEAEVDEYGRVTAGEQPGDAARVQENSYTVIPGHTYVKDPVIYVEEGSEASWLFLSLINPMESFESTKDDYASIEDQLIANGWDEYDAANHYWVYTNSVDTNGNPVVETATTAYDSAMIGALPEIAAGGDDQQIKTFASFTIDTKWDDETEWEALEANAQKIIVKAYAVQAMDVTLEEAKAMANTAFTSMADADYQDGGADFATN